MATAFQGTADDSKLKYRQGAYAAVAVVGYRSATPSRFAAVPITAGIFMSLISFIEHAGEKLFGGAGASSNVAELNAAAGTAIAQYIASQKLSAQNLTVTYDGATRTVTVGSSSLSKVGRIGAVSSAARVASLLARAAEFAACGVA